MIAEAPLRRPLRYLTEEWAEKALEVVETDGAVRKAVDGLDLSILAIITSPPEGCYGFIYVSFKEDGLAEYRVGFDYDSVTTGIDAPTFVVSGPYDVFAAVNRGDLSERRALLTGRLHLTGGLWKALRYMNALETVTETLNSIECEV